MNHYDKIFNFVKETPGKTIPEISASLRIPEEDVTPILRKNGEFIWEFIDWNRWGEGLGDPVWDVWPEIVEDPDNGWLSPEGKLSACRDGDHRPLADNLHKRGEKGLEKLGWIKLKRKEFMLWLLGGDLEKPITQAQYNYMYDYYMKREMKHEIYVLNLRMDSDGTRSA